MACCIFTAYVMNRIIKACEILDIKLINIQYNDFDDGDDVEAKAEVSQSLAVSVLSIDGMTCAACVTAIENALKALQGVYAVSVSLALARATVVHDTEVNPVSHIVTTIQNTGYDAQAGVRSALQNLEIAEQKARLANLRASFTQAVTASTIITSINSIWKHLPFLDHHVALSSLFSVVVGTWVQIVIAQEIHRSAWSRGFLSRPTMDTLISLSILAGLIIASLDLYQCQFESAVGYLTSGSFLVAVVIGGRYIQTLLERQTATSLAQLYDLQSKAALVQVKPRSCTGEPTKIPALALRSGHEIVLDPGSIVPCDCYILAGKCLVDQSTMTGESLPVSCGAGDFLMSGTRILGSTVVAVVTNSQEDSALNQLIASISTATETGHDAAATDFLTAYFVQLMLLLALYTFVAAVYRGSEKTSLIFTFHMAAERAMAVLASACPCALGLATPSAVLSGISVAWNKGIIFTRGAPTIQQLARLTHVVMDKTGTLTRGKLSVSEADGCLQSWQYMLICAAEKQDAQVHPVARAVFKWALSQLDETQRSEQNNVQILEHVSEPGKGVHCQISLSKPCDASYEIHIGTRAFLQDSGVQFPPPQTEAQSNAITVNIAINRTLAASLTLQDTIRPETPATVRYLRDHLSPDLAMLTGDTHAEAARVSALLSIPVMSSRALPQSKKSFVQTLQSPSRSPQNDNKTCVAMVGDGVNDAPALAAADVGILLSPGLSLSNRMCVQAADVILTTPNLGGIIEAVLIAQMTQRQIRLNRAWALLYNFVAVAAAMGVFERWGVRVDASMAGTLMAGSSVSVVALSLVLRKRLQAINFGSLVEEVFLKKDEKKEIELVG